MLSFLIGVAVYEKDFQKNCTIFERALRARFNPGMWDETDVNPPDEQKESEQFKNVFKNVENRL